MVMAMRGVPINRWEVILARDLKSLERKEIIGYGNPLSLLVSKPKPRYSLELNQPWRRPSSWSKEEELEVKA